MKRHAMLALGAFFVLLAFIVTSESIGFTDLRANANKLGDRDIVAREADHTLQRHRLFQLVKSEFPVWYERLLQEFAQPTLDGESVDRIARLTQKIAAIFRVQHAHFAIRARPEKLDELVRGRLEFLEWLETNNSAVCSQLIQTDLSRGSRFAGPEQQREYIAALQKKVAAELEAIIDSHMHQLKYATPSKKDYQIFYEQLSAHGWSHSQIQKYVQLINSNANSNIEYCDDARRILEAVVSIEDQGTRSRLIVKLLTSPAISI